MQINSATALPFIPVTMSLNTNGKTTASSPSSDEAVLSDSAKSFAGLVNDAKAYPEVRSDLVASYKTQIANGTYPSPATLDGLTEALSGLVS
jgi:anti-sigma28 factor (negative regulator of flagellin synthesis)